MTKRLPSNEYDETIDVLRKYRVMTSYYKYGPAAINYGKGLIKALPTMQQCVDKYKSTKNKEYLLDAMNYLMFEYMYPSIEGAFFQSTDSDSSAGIVGMSINEMENFKKDNPD